MKNIFSKKPLALLLSGLLAAPVLAQAADCVNSWTSEGALSVPAVDLGGGKLYALTLAPNRRLDTGGYPWYSVALSAAASSACTPTATYDPQTNVFLVNGIQDPHRRGPADATMDAAFVYDPRASTNGSIDLALYDYKMRNTKVYLAAYMGRPFSDVSVEFRNLDGTPLAAQPAKPLVAWDNDDAYVEAKLAELPGAFQVKLTYTDTQTGQTRTHKASVERYEGNDLRFNPLTTLVSAWMERHPYVDKDTAEKAIRTFIGANDQDMDLVDLGEKNTGSVFSLQSFLQQADAAGGQDALIARLLDEQEHGLQHFFRFDPQSGIFAEDDVSDQFAKQLSKFGPDVGKVIVKGLFDKKGLVAHLAEHPGDPASVAADIFFAATGLDEVFAETDPTQAALKEIDAKLDALKADVEEVRRVTGLTYVKTYKKDYDDSARVPEMVLGDIINAAEELKRSEALKKANTNDAAAAAQTAAEHLAEFNRLMETVVADGASNANYISQRMQYNFLNGAAPGLVSLYNSYIYANADNKGYFNVADENDLWMTFYQWRTKQAVALTYTLAYWAQKGKNTDSVTLQGIMDNFKRVWDGEELLMPKNRLSESEACATNAGTPNSKTGSCFLDLRNATKDGPLMWMPQVLAYPEKTGVQGPVLFADVLKSAPVFYAATTYTSGLFTLQDLTTGKKYASEAATVLEQSAAKALAGTDLSVRNKDLLASWRIPRAAEWKNLLNGKKEATSDYWMERAAGTDATSWSAIAAKSYYLAQKDSSYAVPSQTVGSSDLFDYTDISQFSRGYPIALVNLDDPSADQVSLNAISTTNSDSWSCYLNTACRGYSLEKPVGFVPVRQVPATEQYYLK